MNKQTKKKKKVANSLFSFRLVSEFFSSLTQLQATTITQRRLNATCDVRT